MKLSAICLRVVLLCCAVLPACDGGVTEEPAGSEVAIAPTPEPKPVNQIDGAALFLEHCAGCHGKTGDGKGSTKLPRPARNFRAGGFAFGNTEEALFKMVTSGMPGQNPMPSFADILTENERRAVVQHVLTLVPQEQRKPAKDRVLQVKDQTLIARGLLPAMAKGAPAWPRGLLLGLPAGWTLAYSTEDTRLLGGYFGAFCDRTDWDQRGGGALKPVGKLMFLMGKGNPTTSWKTAKGSQPIAAQFKASFADGNEGGVEYSLKLPGGMVTIRETCEFVQTSVGSGIRRTFEIPPTTDHILLGQLQEVWGWRKLKVKRGGKAVKGKRSEPTTTTDMLTWERSTNDYTVLVVGGADPEEASSGSPAAGVTLIAYDQNGASGEIQMSLTPSKRTRKIWLARCFLQSDSHATIQQLHKELSQ